MLPRVSRAGRIAELRGVGHGADAYAVEDDPDDTAEHET